LGVPRTGVNPEQTGIPGPDNRLPQL
jgi:hypothetical protein